MKVIKINMDESMFTILKDFGPVVGEAYSVQYEDEWIDYVCIQNDAGFPQLLNLQTMYLADAVWCREEALNLPARRYIDCRLTLVQ